MQFESLEVFCDLAETESFTKAARINGVTQSAVSQTISSLERTFKSLLIERSKKNFRLTPEGEVLYDYSKRLLQLHDAIESKMQEIKNIVSGDIRIATVYSIGLHELPPCVKQFLKAHPSVNIHVSYRRANQVYEDVVGNVVDLGLLAFPVRDPRLEVVPLRKDSLVLVCSPENPLARQKKLKLKDLNGRRYINFEKDIPTRKALDKLFKEANVTVQTVMEFDNVETVKRAVEIGSGVAILPEDTIKQEVANQTLAAVRFDTDYRRELGAVYKKGKVLSPALKKFIELLKHSL